MSDRHRVVVAALIHRMRDRMHPEVLIMRRPPDARFFPDVWVAPGGGVEIADMVVSPADEFGIRALRRELAEEIGPDVEVEIRKYDLRGQRAFVRGDGTGVVVLTYVVRWLRGEPKRTSEAVDFAWVGLDEIGDYDLIGDTTQEIVDAIRLVSPF